MREAPKLRRFLLRRLGGGLVAIAGAALLVFFVRHLVPGDPVDALAGGEQADAVDKAAVRECLDLDKSIGGQLVAFAKEIGSGTFGRSCIAPHPTVSGIIARS